jgi:AmmeMemoRadiSam system protein B
MRKPAVAGRFYPNSPAKLSQTVNELLPQGNGSDPQKCLAVVCPHAGYIYSGSLAAETLGSVLIPETVILIGPNHHGQGAPIALSTTTWDMPFGNVPVNNELSTLLHDHSPHINMDELAHEFEHSLEVQIPFLQQLQKNLSIVPLVVSQISYDLCEAVGKSLASAIQEYGKDTLIVASSDMSHYEPRTNAEKKDRLAIQDIERLSPRDLYTTVLSNRISMCGVIPVVITLLATKILGANQARLVGYTDSGYLSGDTGQVVGYAGVIIS